VVLGTLDVLDAVSAVMRGMVRSKRQHMSEVQLRVDARTDTNPHLPPIANSTNARGVRFIDRFTLNALTSMGYQQR
jgi:hypothetical protein